MTARHGELLELQNTLTAVQAAETEQRETAKAQKEEGDRIYWVIYNLDAKNPNTKHDYKYLPPLEVIDQILQKEAQIEALVADMKLILTET